MDNILFMDGDDFYAAEIRNIDLQANSGQLFAVVPEPATAMLSMLGLASMLMRRRRKAKTAPNAHNPLGGRRCIRVC